MFGGLIKAVGGLVKKVAAPALGFATGGIATGAIGLAGSLLRRGGSSAGPAIAATRVPALPFAPPTIYGGGGAPPRVPQRGAVATLRRAVPGGRSGYTYDPYDLNTPSDKLGRPVAVHAELRERISCPPGYVGVDLDGDGVKDACVLKGVARAMGLYKSRPKPPVTGYEARAIRTASRVRKNVAKLARSTGLHVSTTRPQRAGGKKKR